MTSGLPGPSIEIRRRYTSGGPGHGDGRPSGALTHERRHPDPRGHRAGRPPGGRSSSCPWCTTSCAGSPPPAWPARRRGRRSSPRCWCMRPTCGWSAATRTRPSTAAATSSPRRPRRCGASSSTEPAPASGLKRGGGRPAGPVRPRRPAGRAPRRRPAGPRRGPDRPGRRGPRRRQAGQAPGLRRADARARPPWRWASASRRPTATGATPAPGSARPSPARGLRIPEKKSPRWGTAARDGALGGGPV